MYKGIYIALSGAIGKQKQVDILAQNIANATTTGYKKEKISFKNYMMSSDNSMGTVNDGRSMSEISSVVTDFTGGTLLRTGNPLDLGINGKGFFALEGNKYTRNGNFKIDNDGDLATQDNNKVMGGGGPISIQGTKINISSSGEVFVDDVSAGTIRVVDFPDKHVLTKLNGGVFLSEEAGSEVTPDISQGYLEASNVEAVREMIYMLKSLREFETYQKIIHAMDDATSKTNNEMGR